MLEYRQVLEANPNDVEALNPIAWIRATHADPKHRDAQEAVALAERARDALQTPNAVVFETLAAAYAEAGRFDDAVTACGRAIALAQASGGTKDADRFREELELYRARKPLRVN